MSRYQTTAGESRRKLRNDPNDPATPERENRGHASRRRLTPGSSSRHATVRVAGPNGRIPPRPPIVTSTPVNTPNGTVVRGGAPPTSVSSVRSESSPARSPRRGGPGKTASRERPFPSGEARHRNDENPHDRRASRRRTRPPRVRGYPIGIGVAGYRDGGHPVEGGRGDDRRVDNGTVRSGLWMEP